MYILHICRCLYIPYIDGCSTSHAQMYVVHTYRCHYILCIDECNAYMWTLLYILHVVLPYTHWCTHKHHCTLDCVILLLLICTGCKWLGLLYLAALDWQSYFFYFLFFLFIYFFFYNIIQQPMAAKASRPSLVAQKHHNVTQCII